MQPCEVLDANTETARGGRMTRDKHQEMMILADMIQGEINRMCVTDDMIELNNMSLYARNNIGKLRDMREADLQKGKKND